MGSCASHLVLYKFYTLRGREKALREILSFFPDDEVSMLHRNLCRNQKKDKHLEKIDDLVKRYFFRHEELINNLTRELLIDFCHAKDIPLFPFEKKMRIFRRIEERCVYVLVKDCCI